MADTLKIMARISQLPSSPCLPYSIQNWNQHLPLFGWQAHFPDNLDFMHFNFKFLFADNENCSKNAKLNFAIFCCVSF